MATIFIGQNMKLSVGKLRKIIREVLAEETAFPGGAHGAGKLSDEDQERLAYQGFRDIHSDEEVNMSEELEEAKKKPSCSGCKGKKPGLWCNICKKRQRGEAPAKRGEKGYPKTLDIEEVSGEIKNQ
jgi:hypothetical protein